MIHQTAQRTKPHSSIHWTLLIILLIGAWFRWASLGRMNDMLHYDEAYNGIDAASLLDAPRLTPFFPDNFGRESGWHYLAAPFIAIWGATPFSMRLLSTMLGILTLAAIYPLGQELLGPTGATWSAASLAVLYWHVHISQLALRAILFPLLGVLALACLLNARRTNTRRAWLCGGLFLGLMAYSYFSALLWIIYTVLSLLAWTRSSERRRGALIALTIAAVLALPLVIYTIRDPAHTLTRTNTVAAASMTQIANNSLLWAKAWFETGDTIPEFNLKGRPILDPYLGTLVLAGLAGLFLAVRRKWDSLWLLGLALFAMLPSILSENAPHFLRAVGLTIPISLLTGAGAQTAQRLVQRISGRNTLALLLPLALLSASGAIAYRDFHQRWLNHPETFWFMEEHVNRAANFIKANTAGAMPVYLAPFAPGHPVVILRSRDLAPRYVGTFDPQQCLVIADRPAIYVALTQYQPEFEQTMSKWLEMTILDQDRNAAGKRPRYTVFRAAPRADAPLAGKTTFMFADTLRLRAIQPISDTARPGQRIPILLALDTRRPLKRPYSVFVHLYGDPAPAQGGAIWGYGDSQLCVSYPTNFWRPGESVLQQFTLNVAPNTPPGDYDIAVGVYESPAGARLPVTNPESPPADYILLKTIHVQQ